MSKTKTDKVSYSTWYTLRECVAILWRFRPSYIVMQIAFGLYTALWGYFGFHMIGYFLDIITSHEIQSLGEQHFILPFILYIGLFYAYRLILNLKDIENYDFSRKFQSHLTDLLATKRSSLELAQLDDPKISNISMKANENLGRIDNYIDIISTLLQQFYNVVTATIIILPWSSLVALFSILSVTPEYFVTKKLQLSRFKVYDNNITPRRKYSDYRSFITATTKVREVKLGNISNYLIDVSRSIMDAINAEARQVDYQKLRGRILSLIFLVLGFAIGLYSVYNDLIVAVISIGFATILIAQIHSLRENLSSSFYKFNQLESQSLYMQDIFRFLDIESTLVDGETTLPKQIQHISLESINFRYPGSEKTVLSNINLSIPHGSKVAIVGENGAGKSTLTKLILRYYDPTSGSVTINDTPLSEFRRADWYQRISYMPQDYNKYPFVLREVITLGEPADHFDQERYDRALQISQTDKLIESLPNGDQTILSPQFEGGTELSVGQSQKVAIARVLYRPSDILILDEPTSAIDAISELHIFNAIENLPESQTVILISHRFNTVKNADIIVVLEHGTIVESGTHEELMNNHNRYYEMYTAQKDSYE